MEPAASRRTPRRVRFAKAAFRKTILTESLASDSAAYLILARIFDSDAVRDTWSRAASLLLQRTESRLLPREPHPPSSPSTRGGIGIGYVKTKCHHRPAGL
ncbi:hypothetical protein THIOKS11060021 [Thiocapsa sp. KS1]|nr:hypothetical protein THIOKS11060021 [Thiocapsa sp. KS1]